MDRLRYALRCAGRSELRTDQPVHPWSELVLESADAMGTELDLRQTGQRVRGNDRIFLLPEHDRRPGAYHLLKTRNFPFLADRTVGFFYLCSDSLSMKIFNGKSDKKE